MGNSVLPSTKRENSGIKVCLHLVTAVFCQHVLLEPRDQQTTETKVFGFFLLAGSHQKNLALPQIGAVSHFE